jgi:hypothetical protein
MDNGFIDSAFYFIKGDTYLYLDAHKTLKLTTADAGIFYHFQNHLVSLGYKQLSPFIVFNTDSIITITGI